MSCARGHAAADGCARPPFAPMTPSGAPRHAGWHRDACVDLRRPRALPRQQTDQRRATARDRRDGETEGKDAARGRQTTARLEAREQEPRTSARKWYTARSHEQVQSRESPHEHDANHGRPPGVFYFLFRLIICLRVFARARPEATGRNWRSGDRGMGAVRRQARGERDLVASKHGTRARGGEVRGRARIQVQFRNGAERVATGACGDQTSSAGERTTPISTNGASRFFTDDCEGHDAERLSGEETARW